MGKEHRLALMPRGWTVALARIATGWVCFRYGWYDKLQDQGFVTGMADTLRKMAQDSAPAFYRPFLEQVAIPNSHLFALAVAWGEALLGVSLLLGAFTNLASLLGIVLMVNLYLASGSWEALLYASLCLVFLRLSAGSRWGVDPVLAKLLPERVVYFPTR
jgi:thiosulfate dehydrogenase (quinone) large subunit